jgi:hypothetical protein
MEDSTRRTPDLATIVLGDERARRSAERRGRLRGQVASGTGMRDGYDARSVLVLAVVVAVLATVIGWSTTIAREEDPPAPTKVDVAPRTETVSKDAAASDVAGPGMGAVVAPPKGVQLQVGRIVASKSGNGGGILRVGVANRGAVDGDEALGTQLLVLMDGEVVGERSLSALDAGASASTEVGLDTCPSGRHTVVAIVDPRGAIAEADDRDNAVSSTVSFGC